MAKGRKTGGKQKGYKAPNTVEKEIERERLRQMVCAELEPMVQAQIAHAKGLRYLVARHKKNGKFAKLTEELALSIADGENPDYETIEVWAKDPSSQAFADLMNRTLDKPAEQVTVSGQDGGPIVHLFRWQK